MKKLVDAEAAGIKEANRAVPWKRSDFKVHIPPYDN